MNEHSKDKKQTYFEGRTRTAGVPESLLEYFLKETLSGPKVVRRYWDKFAKTVLEHLKVCKIQNILMLYFLLTIS